MTPQGVRVRRRDQRRAWKGQPRGRRVSHAVRTTYRRGQQAAISAAEFSAWCAARREAQAGGAA